VWVKICGITTVEDACRAIEAGADAIGINLVAGPRRVDVAQASEIAASVSKPDRLVPLVDVTDGRLDPEVDDWIVRVGIRRLQLYGDVTGSFIASQVRARRCPIAVARVRGPDFADAFNRLLRACGDNPPSAVVVDAYHPRQLGGAGRPFRWDWLVEARRRGELEGWPPVIVAGGLLPENVASVVATVRPWGVDVSSGVESGPGRKDPTKVLTFIRNARRAEDDVEPQSARSA